MTGQFGHIGAMDGDFDFIIVGAGSAGCVLAYKLTASGQYKVLLLEAGGSDMRFYIQMPLGYGKTFYDPAVNWMYSAEADPGLAGQVDFWPRGKVLGGSSSINAMVYVRGDASDFEDWKQAGNTGWGWDEVLSAYKLMEDNEAGGDAWRGSGGPLFISANTHSRHWTTKPFEDASVAAGLPAQCRFQRRLTGRCRPFSAHHQRRHGAIPRHALFSTLPCAAKISPS